MVLALCLIPFTTAFAQLNPAHWNFNVKELSSNEVELQFQLKLDEGWHIYSQKSDPNGPIPSEYTFEDNANYKRVGGVAEPKSHDEFDEIFKCTVRSFSGKVTFRQKIKRNTDKAFEVKGSMYYQLCNDGSCIAPDDVPFTFKVPASTMPANEENEPEIAENVDTAIVEPIVDEESAAPAAEVAAADPEPQEPENKKSLLGLFFGALLAGIVTMFTPCVFPMIPMTVNFFMHSSDNKRKNRRQAWFFGFSLREDFPVAIVVAVLRSYGAQLHRHPRHSEPDILCNILRFRPLVLRPLRDKDAREVGQRQRCASR